MTLGNVGMAGELGRRVFLRSLGAVAPFLGLVVALAGARGARADVFNLSHFVNPGEFAIGLEPELAFGGESQSGAGMGVNLRYTQGLTDLLDLSAIVGTGAGPRQFRLGADLDLDLFPDLDKQPGVGVALRGLWVRVPTPGRLEGSHDLSEQGEFTAIPFIHKTFGSAGKTEIDPFFSMPVGVAYLEGRAELVTTAVIGAMIKGSEHVWANTEFGIAVNHSESYFSGGLTYYH